MHIRKEDIVQILTGDDKGKRGRVLRVMADKGKILVEGVNRVYKHLKPSRRNPQGGRLSKEMPIDVSNVQIVCSSCGKPTRIGHRFEGDTKVRFCRKCEATL